MSIVMPDQQASRQAGHLPDCFAVCQIKKKIIGFDETTELTFWVRLRPRPDYVARPLLTYFSFSETTIPLKEGSEGDGIITFSQSGSNTTMYLQLSDSDFKNRDSRLVWKISELTNQRTQNDSKAHKETLSSRPLSQAVDIEIRWRPN